MSETQSKRHPHLTKTEVFVVRAIVAGHTSTKEMKTAYDFNPRTLQTHLRNIYRKTGAYNRRTSC
jgi:DNA-binding CsgD family transcriptional regulator